MYRRIIFGLSLIFVLFSFYPSWYELMSRNRLQPERYFELVHNFPTDYNFYLSRIRQGIEGRLTVREKYTSEPHAGSFIHVMYLAMGWVGGWVRVPWHRSGDVYHVARIVLGVALLVMIGEFVKKSSGAAMRVLPRAFPQENPQGDPFLGAPLRASPAVIWPVLAFLLAITASTWPKWVQVGSSYRFGGYMPWWSVMDSLQRITFVPHLLAGQALIIFLILAGTDEATMKRPGNWLFLGILAFVLGLIFPPGLIFVGTTYGILIIAEVGTSWFSPRQGPDRSFFHRGIFAKAVTRLETSRLPATLHHSNSLILIVLLGLSALIYLQLMTSFYPWKELALADILHPLPFKYLEYFQAVGPVLPLGLLGLLVALIKKEKAMLPVLSWVGAWLLLLFIFRFVPQQSPLRFSEMLPHVPLAILTIYFFYNFYNSYKHYIFLVLPALLILLNFGIMYSSFLWQRDFVDHKIRAALPLVPTGSYVMYPLRDFIAAINFLQDATSRETVILSETTAGNYLPVYSGNAVYVGHANTARRDQKEPLVRQFFAGVMTPEVARAWLAQGNLNYIFFGPQEREDGGIDDLARIYPFLEKIYENNFVTVYKRLSNNPIN